ncbi:MAG: hypothetical protein PWQ12_1711 [Clostridiales bacterium]|nr:hypothetical protein [Clostridiales bacterium]
MNRRHLTGMVLAAALLVGSVPVPSSASDRALTLAQAQEIALSGNLAIKQAEENASVADYKLEYAYDDVGSVGTDAVETAKHKEYYEKEAEYGSDFAYWALEQTKREQALLVATSYMNLVHLDREALYQKQVVSDLEAQLSRVEKSIEAGKAVPSEKEKVLLEIEKAKNIVSQIDHQTAEEKRQFNQLLGQDLTASVVVQAMDIPLEAISVDDMQALIDNQIERNGDLERIHDDKALLSIELDVYESLNYLGEYDRTIVSIKEGITQKRHEYDMYRLQMDYDIRSEYNDLQNAYDACLIQELTVANLQIDYDTALKKKEIGLLTAEAVDGYAEKLERAKLDSESLKITYYVLAEDFSNYMTDME